MRFLRLAVLGLALSAAPIVALSCSPESGLSSDGSAQGGSGAGSAGAGGGAPSGGSQSGGDGVGGGIDPDAACGAVHEEANLTPLNLYIMVDRSVSMDTAGKWQAAKTGLAAFLNDPASAGVRAAIRFFPRTPDATPACEQTAYKTPIVDFAELPGNAAPIIAAMDATSPSGFDSPIYPALGGAILKTIEVVENAPGDSAAVLLVTDGEPNGPGTSCSGVDPNDPQVIADLAQAGYEFDPSVTTFVVGLPGVNQTFANLVAQAGGSGAAILVGATNVEVEFQNALKQVLGQALPCEFEIPVKVKLGEVQINQVNVEITPGDGSDPVIVPQNPACNGPGWYYDDNIVPTKIILCPETCALLKDDLQAGIDILLGCETIIP